MTHLALDPVSVAVYNALFVESLKILATGGISDDPGKNTTFPFIWYEVSERDVRGLGTGGLPEVTLKVHVFSQKPGMTEAQTIMRQVVALLRDVALTVSGYDHCGRVFYDETVTFPDEILNNVKVHELVSSFRIYVEE